MLARIARASDVEAFKANWRRILYDFREIGKKGSRFLINETMAKRQSGLQDAIAKRRRAAHAGQRLNAKQYAVAVHKELPTEGMVLPV